jgi:AcrR family transcriptional regulator
MFIEMSPRVKPAPAPAGGGVRKRQKAQTREALLEAARRVLAREGLASTTTREVAREAGVAAGTFFVHFPDVDALVEALLDEHLAAALGSAYRTLPKGADVVGRLVHVSRKLFEAYDVDPDLSRQYLSASLFRVRRSGPTEARFSALQRWVLDELAAHGGADGALPAPLAFAAYFSLYFGLLVAGLRGQLRRQEQLALLDTSLRRLLGVKART